MPAFTPDDALAQHSATIPEEIFEIVNGFLAERVHNRTIEIEQREIAAKLELTDISEAQAISHGWLDFEDVYKKAGWIVNFDKPGFNESYQPIWTFEKPQTLT